MENIFNRTWAEVDIDNILHNVRVIKDTLTGNSKIIAVVKADAYGHGAVAVAKALEKETDMFALSSIDEVVQLRNAGVRGDMLILGYTPSQFAKVLQNEKITQTVFSYDYIKDIYDSLDGKGDKLKVHVKLDTGMSRLGFAVQNDEMRKKTVEELFRAVNEFSDRLDFEGIFTHFAVSDEPEQDFTDIQFYRYIKTVEELEEKGVHFSIHHVCNSAAVINYPQYHLERCRPGIILFGMLPDKHTRDIGLRPALSLKAVVSQTRTIEEGMTVSYGRKFTAAKKTTLATLPIGYADGYSRLLSDNGEVLIHGKRAKIVGRICMDQCMVDVSDIPNVKRGDEVTIIGRDGDEVISATDIADRMNTINYEITCLIGKRVPRVYIKDGKKIGSYSSILD